MAVPLYILHLAHPQSQRILVELQWATTQADSEIRFASWTPGSYKIRDYARHVIGVRASADGQPLGISKSAKDTYVVSCASGTAVRVVFELMATDDSVRGAWLDPYRGHFEGAAIFPCLVGREDSPVNIELRPPPGREWQCATSLTPSDTAATVAGWGHYRAASWRELIDQPLLMGTLSECTFSSGGCDHRFVIAGAEHLPFAMDRLRNDAEAIVSRQIAAMAGTPNTQYLFALRVSPQGDGGLEHERSTLLACSAASLPQVDADSSRGYERLLGLISHEYFHLWNVKRIRPRAVAESDLRAEAPFPDLWAYEGVTAYVDDWFLRQAGVRSVGQFLQVLSENLTRLQRTPGRLRQSLVEASEEAWIRLYQPELHLPLSTVSYYLKGALVAMALDILLRVHSNDQLSLIALLAAQYRDWQRDPRPLEPHALEHRVRSVCPAPAIDALFRDCIYGTADPDFPALLAEVGLDAELRPAHGLFDDGGVRADAPIPAHLGLRPAREGALRIGLVEPESAAERLGLCAGDELVAIQGQRLAQWSDVNALLSTLQAGTPVTLQWTHDGQVRAGTTVADPAPRDRWQVTLRSDDALTPAIRARRRQWLGLDS